MSILKKSPEKKKTPTLSASSSPSKHCEVAGWSMIRRRQEQAKYKCDSSRPTIHAYPMSRFDDWPIYQRLAFEDQLTDMEG